MIVRCPVDYLRTRVKVIMILSLAAASSGCSKHEADLPDMTDRPPFKSLLSEANDFDLVNGTFIRIGDRYRHWVDASKYTPAERVIMLVWHASGIIENGGFEYLFSGDFDGDPEFTITAEAFREAGLTRSYEAFQEAFKLFPNGVVPHDSEERISRYKMADEEVRERISQMVWQDGWDKLREKKLAQFIRENVSKLGDLDASH